MPSVMTRAFAIEAVGEIVAINIVEPKNVKGRIEIEEVGMSIGSGWSRVIWISWRQQICSGR